MCIGGWCIYMIYCARESFNNEKIALTIEYPEFLPEIWVCGFGLDGSSLA